MITNVTRLLNENADLRERNRELREALEILASIPLEEFGHDKRADLTPISGWNNVTLTVGHVRKARAALKVSQ